MHMEMFLFYFQKLKVKESDVMPFIFSNWNGSFPVFKICFLPDVRGAYNDPLISFIEKV